jgi:hypothetical protein
VAATKDILEGVATLLAGAGLGLSWNPLGVYTAGQTGIFMMTMPPTPDRCVTLALVDTDDNPTMPLGSKMLQVRGRGAANDPLDVGELLDPIFDTLHARENLTVGGQTIIQILRRVSAPMGADDQYRWERADQYYLDVDAAPTALRPAGGSW